MVIEIDYTAVNFTGLHFIVKSVIALAPVYILK